MNDQEKLRYILACRRRGITYRAIGKALNMSHVGVMYLERRLTDPDAHYRSRNGEDFGDEVDHRDAPREDW